MEKTNRLSPMSPHTASPAVQQLSTTELISEVGSKATQLVTKEIQLARTEFTEQVNAELAMVKRLSLAAVAAVSCLNLLLVAAVFGLEPYLAAWLAALALAGVVLLVAVVAAVLAWNKHVARPLPITRQMLKEDVQWAKEEIA